MPDIPKKPAFYRNKDVKKNQLPKGSLSKLAASKTPKVKVVNSSNFEITMKEKQGSAAFSQGLSLDERMKMYDKGDLGMSTSDSSPESDQASTKIQKSHSLNMRYRIPKKLDRLFEDSPETLKKLANYINEQVRLSDNDRAIFIQRLAQYRQCWQDFVSAGMDLAFQGAHDVHVPIAYSSIKAMHARIYQAVMGITPAFSLKPRSKVSEIQKENKEELLNWVIGDFANCQQGWDGVIDKDIMNFVADGVAITKQSWKRDIRKFTDVEETVSRPLKLDEDGFPIMDEKEVEREEIVWDCPILETVELEDVWIIGKDRWDVDSADLIDHMQKFTKSDMIKMSRLGFFQSDAVNSVLATPPSGAPNQNVNLLNQELKYQADYLSGIEKTTSRAGPSTYTVHECYLSYDIDEDGINEELVVWYEEKSRQILRITYLDRVGPGGKRPFTIKLFTPDGKGLGEMLYGLNNEIDYIHNQRLDYGTLQNLPFFFYRAASGLNPIELKLGPGMGIPVDSPSEDVYFPSLSNRTAYGFQEEAQVTQYAEKVSGITGFSLGQISSQGATRTATGTSALVNELNSNIDIHIKRFQRGYKRNLYILDLQCQDLLPLGTVIRVAGVDGKDIYKRFEDRAALKFQSDFELTANSINSNKAIERETAQMLLQSLANPIALQTGITTQANLYNAYKNMLQKFEIKDIDAYITKPADAPDSPYSAKDEINMIIAGVEPTLVVKDKHVEKLALFDEFENSDDFGYLTADHIPLYSKVKAYHQQMADAIASQAANPLLQNGVNDLGLAGQLAAGGGQAAAGPAQQQSDLGQVGGQLNPA